MHVKVGVAVKRRGMGVCSTGVGVGVNDVTATGVGGVGVSVGWLLTKLAMAIPRAMPPMHNTALIVAIIQIGPLTRPLGFLAGL